MHTSGRYYSHSTIVNYNDWKISTTLELQFTIIGRTFIRLTTEKQGYLLVICNVKKTNCRNIPIFHVLALPSYRFLVC